MEGPKQLDGGGKPGVKRELTLTINDVDESVWRGDQEDSEAFFSMFPMKLEVEDQDIDAQEGDLIGLDDIQYTVVKRISGREFLVRLMPPNHTQEEA